MTNLEDSARWDAIELRSDDIIISTPGKCGTTWMQMICALLVFQTPNLPMGLHDVSPWVDVNDGVPIEDVIRRIDAQKHRRVLKTHTPLDGLPIADGVTYIGVGRDPRDVAGSARDHLLNKKTPAGAARPPVADLSEEDFFWWWVENDLPITEVPVGLRRTVHHLAGFWQRRDEPQFVLLHYADLADDLHGQMRMLASQLGIDIDESRWPALVDAATFDSMKSNSDATAPGTHDHWHDKGAFFRQGRRRSWENLLADDASRERYDRRAAMLLDPELSRWLHRS